jgi:hypothetical protein
MEDEPLSGGALKSVAGEEFSKSRGERSQSKSLLN